MSLYKQFETNESLEKEGVILNYGVNSKGQNIDIRIARAGGHNTRFNKIAEQVLKPYRRQLANETADREITDRLMRIIYARAVILEWSGVEDKAGKPMEFTEANAIKLFTDLPDLFSDIREQADKQALFRKEALEEESKN